MHDRGDVAVEEGQELLVEAHHLEVLTEKLCVDSQQLWDFALELGDQPVLTC